MIGRTIGRYRVLARLGEGGMATVWRAEDTLLGRVVALKVLSEELARSALGRRRFLHEARNCSRLDHPGIVPIYDVGESDGLIYIALSCVDGVTLHDYAARGPLPQSEVLRIGIALADSIGHAHAHGVVHRDLTSRNVMVARDGRVFVLDFGLAHAAGDSRITSTGVILGTLEYLSPEVIQATPADERSDLYGLGVLLYEMATGTTPFRGQVRDALLYSIVNVVPEAPRRRRSDLLPDLERIIVRALEKRPARRYRSAAEMLADLRSIRPPAWETANAIEYELPAASSDGADTVSISEAPTLAPESELLSARVDLPSPTFLAILPFESVGVTQADREELVVLAHGLSNAIAAALAGLEDLHVIPPSIEVVPALAHQDVRRLARSIGANLLLRGSVRRSASEVRISFALIHPFRGVQLAGGTVSGVAEDLFRLEDELVAAVRSALGRDTAPARDDARPRRGRVARERYLQALGYLLRYDNEASIDGAIRILEELAEDDPRSAAMQAALARACLYKYQLTFGITWENRAAECCQRARELDPVLPEVRLTLGELHLAVGRHREAIQELESVLELQRDLPAALIALSRAYAAAGDLNAAERVCRRAIAVQPEFWGHYNELGKLFAKEGRFREALEPWGEVVRLAPDNSRGWLNLGATYFRLDRWDESVAHFERSVRVTPSPRAYSGLASALFCLDRVPEAVEALKRGIDLNPSDHVPWGNLGSVLRWTPGREPEAKLPLERGVMLLKQRLEDNPERSEDWTHLASWLANLGQFEAAREAICRGIALPSFDVHGMARAAEVFHQLGDRASCWSWLREALRRGYRPGRLRRHGPFRDLEGDPEFEALLAEAEQSEAEVDQPNRTPGGES